ncbi:MAG TPA: class I SAM-dependent methyltransferase [Nitrososphaera sp.]|nr:class I SAM-dependent methyltransferase [Nitrososphaera sp.]
MKKEVEEEHGYPYDPVKYKINSIQNWNTVAPGYIETGPAREGARSGQLSSLSKLQTSGWSMVLDVACGTGVVSMQVAQLRGPPGMLVGIDFSRGALNIARSSVPTGHFVEMDAENIGFELKFNRIVCQYALMFFPEPEQVLRRLWTLLKNGDKLAIAVHWTPEGVPYFNTVMRPVLRYKPDIRPEGTPTVHRFGSRTDLQRIIASARFSKISIEEFVYEYEAGTFEEYWSDYMSTTANSIRAIIESKGAGVLSAIKAESETKAQKFVKGGNILFPWQVLIATAIQAQN